MLILIRIIKIMSDSENFDDKEKLDFILKQTLGFPSTSDNLNFYEELKTKFNNYSLSESILLESIPQYPDFDISGIVRTANEVGLLSSDFIAYSQDIQNKFNCSIVDDSTGTIRRFKLLKLEQTYNTENTNYGASWYKLDLNSKNILEDSLQYNYKSYYDVLKGNALTFPYLYQIFTELSLTQASNLHNLPFGNQGGNWIYNFMNGILFFADYNNLEQQNIHNGIYRITNSNRPVISVYKYIGRKSIHNLTNQINTLNNSYNNLSLQINALEEATGVNLNVTNKSLFSNNSFLTSTNEIQDLSNSLFSIINISNNRSIIVDINISLYCSYAFDERISVEVWRDLSMILQSKELGHMNATGGLTIPYSITYLDENLNGGQKKYYLKYKLENNNSAEEQGIINVNTSQFLGSSNIILREVDSTFYYSNKIMFTNSNFTTTTSDIQDLSALLFNTINVFNSNIQVNIYLNLYCCYAFDEQITIEVWRDLTLLSQSIDLGPINATGGLTIPYSFSYLDENVSNGTKKYYLKYKLKNNNSNEEQGIINVNLSSNILLRRI